MNILPLEVLPGSRLYVDLIDASTARHGLIVTDAPLFKAFVKMLAETGTEKLTEQNNLLKGMYENALQGYETTLQQYEALLAAYERDTGRRWVYEEGE